MIGALVGALAAAAAFAAGFGVPVAAGAPLLLAVASVGALVGALLGAARAALRRHPAPKAALLGATFAAGVGAAWFALAPPAPAVFLVVVDCLRADRLTRAHLPRTTRRLADAVRFTEARAQSSWTRSAMPSLLSGRYPAEHGLYRTNPPDRLPDDLALVSERFAAAGWMTAAFVQQPQLDPAFGFDRGWSRYGNDDGPAPAVNEKVLAWNLLFRSVPRLVFVHYLDAHGPYTPAPRFRPADLPPTTLALRPFEKWRATLDAIERGTLVPTAEDWAHLRGLYDGELRQLDVRLGALFRALDEDGTLDAGWVVLTADHGERFGERGAGAHMGPPDETVIAVPLLVRPPGGTEARAVDTVVQHVDVVPTLLAAAGLPGDPRLPGRDLGPALRGEALPDRPSFAEEWAADTHHATVREGAWKLWRGATPALYDLATDPGEARDLSAERPDVVARLDGLLAAYFASANGGSSPVDWAKVDWAAAARSGARWTPGARADSPAATTSEETLRALEALGYVVDDGGAAEE